MIGGTVIQTLILIWITLRTDWNKEVRNLWWMMISIVLGNRVKYISRAGSTTRKHALDPPQKYPYEYERVDLHTGIFGVDGIYEWAYQPVAKALHRYRVVIFTLVSGGTNRYLKVLHGLFQARANPRFNIFSLTGALGTDCFTLCLRSRLLVRDTQKTGT